MFKLIYAMNVSLAFASMSCRDRDTLSGAYEFKNKKIFIDGNDSTTFSADFVVKFANDSGRDITIDRLESVDQIKSEGVRTLDSKFYDVDFLQGSRRVVPRKSFVEFKLPFSGHVTKSDYKLFANIRIGGNSRKIELKKGE